MIKTVSGLAFILLFSGTSYAENPWTHDELLQPEQLVQVLKNTPKEKQPRMIHVGFQFLFKNAHIPGSTYVGPANEEAGLGRLRSDLNKVSRTAEIVIYCGCCPFTKCPNAKPAFKAIKAMGFKNVKILNLPDNFKKDWIEKGYPVEKG